MNNKNIQKYIKDSFSKLGLSLSGNQIKMFNKYINFLIKENKKYNLTSITKPEEIVKLHFLDSAAIFSKKDIKGKVIDIGTGAGFPGFVIKILRPEIELTLLESSLKKVNFLKLLQIELDMYQDIEVLHERAEDLAQNNNYRFTYDIVTSRAVAPLNILLEYTAPFCNMNGVILLYKGPSFKEELDTAQNSLNKLNLKFKKAWELEIPLLKGSRYILEFTRKGEILDKYPRRPGIPKKRPL
ncbi:MAG TPA: 16S rRNA (guanine(527)-N(7))-methyltransferase RsmG [Halanaerobiales bacterium]|nr:16S rRNA (guanine(527)-N(7))-methyltransferase RsmG [Halanaerobiales bacterium]